MLVDAIDMYWELRGLVVYVGVYEIMAAMCSSKGTRIHNGTRPIIKLAVSSTK